MPVEVVDISRAYRYEQRFFPNIPGARKSRRRDEFDASLIRPVTTAVIIKPANPAIVKEALQHSFACDYSRKTTPYYFNNLDSNLKGSKLKEVLSANNLEWFSLDGMDTELFRMHSPQFWHRLVTLNTRNNPDALTKLLDTYHASDQISLSILLTESGSETYGLDTHLLGLAALMGDQVQSVLRAEELSPKHLLAIARTGLEFGGVVQTPEELADRTAQVFGQGKGLGMGFKNLYREGALTASHLIASSAECPVKMPPVVRKLREWFIGNHQIVESRCPGAGLANSTYKAFSQALSETSYRQQFISSVTRTH